MNKLGFTRYVVIIVLFGCSFILVIYLLLKSGWVKMNYPNTITYEIRGIDISHHQGNIEFYKLDNKLNFAYLKATEGGDHKDSKFEEYLDSLQHYNIHCGAYHYFSFCKSAEVQFQNLNNTIKDKKLELPIAVDVEFDANCNSKANLKKAKTELKQFLTLISEGYSLPPIIYCNEDFYNQYMDSRFEEYYCWIRNLIKKPKLKNNRSLLFWQYSANGKMPAIKGPVDLNVYVGKRSDYFQNFGIAQ